MKIDPLIKLDFNNALIKSKRSELTSRSQVELMILLIFKKKKNDWFKIFYYSFRHSLTLIGIFTLFTRGSSFK